MSSYCGCNRQAQHPLIRSVSRIIIINTAARRIPAVQRIFCRAIRAVHNRLIKIAVRHRGKGTFLINDARNGIGERRVLHSIQHHSPHSNLSGVRFPPASAEMIRANNFLSFSREEEVELELIPMAAKVCGPAIPSTASPFFR